VASPFNAVMLGKHDSGKGILKQLRRTSLLQREEPVAPKERTHADRHQADLTSAAGASMNVSELWHSTFKRKFMCRGTRCQGVRLRSSLGGNYYDMPAGTWDHQTLTTFVPVALP
jgi:hypothetical protein